VINFSSSILQKQIKTIGLNRRLVYLLFPSKDALIQALLLREVNSYTEAWKRYLESHYRNVESTVGFQTRRELIGEMVPRYQKASISQKGALLDEIAATTGYARRYAMWLLNHPEEMQLPPRRQRQRTFGPEVQRALFFVWQHANQIGTKRLMPYLATHIEALERHGHLYLTDSCRRQLLCMSAAAADRNRLHHSLEPEEWEQVLRASAWYTWRLQDEMQEAWLGRFFLLQMPDRPQEYYLYIQISWANSNQDEWVM
jgi:AcrR family transcriptional regulator